ncbi:testis-expressed protein 11 [Ambystoma mexicanum]|uniref:testis-expressed protein 11 n=1 Tax=Ambystoma mexicanum TaxID=8296 RepID=UPI0037E83269
MEEQSSFMKMKGLIQDLVTNETATNPGEIINTLYSSVDILDWETGQDIPTTQVEECAISLWNWGVTKIMGSFISNEDRAKLRHVACKLVCRCEGVNRSEGTIRRQILMTMKTGKGWVDIGKPSLAEEFLQIAVNSLEHLYTKLTKRTNGESEVNVHKTDVEKDLFKVLSYQAEAAVAQGNFLKASPCVQRCKEMLMRLPRETAYLSVLCYNFGIETYEHKKYEESSFWLSQSYEIGKMDKKYCTGQEMQAKVLRLLATVYLEWDCKLYQDKAVNAICLANEENAHPAGFYLKIKILLKGGEPEDVVRSAVVDLRRHDVSLDFCLNTAKLLLEHGRECVGFEFLKSVCERFESSPDLSRAQLLHIELLLQRGKELLAKQKIEDIITGHYTGKQLSTEILNQLHIVFWDRAAKRFEEKKYTDALQWYNYSFSFYSSGQIDLNLAKLQRNRALCHLHLHHLDKAKEIVKDSERCDPNSIVTQFIVYKIAVLEGDADKAADAIVSMGKLAANATDGEEKVNPYEDTSTNVLSLAAQIALENGQENVAIIALEYLAQQSQDLSQVFASLRCLVRLVLPKVGSASEGKRNSDVALLASYLTTAHQRLADPITKNLAQDTMISDAHWFRKISWNLAIQCDDCPQTMRDLFLLSYKFAQLCPSDKVVLMAQKTCLLMAAAIDLDMGRHASSSTEQIALLTQSLERIHLCRETWTVLKSLGDFSKDPTDTLLLLYEFEVRAKLNDPKLEAMLDAVWELPQLETKTLETIASLAMESPAHYPSICKKCLKSALSLHQKQEPLNVQKFSKCLHSLIQLSLPNGVVDMEACMLEEVWGYYDEALAVFSSIEEYPEVETLWLMTRAWNTGIFLYSVEKYADAERWCGLGMRCLSHLGSLKGSYEAQMTGLYSEILDRLDRAKGLLPNEE